MLLRKELEAMTVKELREIMAGMKIIIPSGTRKGGLVALTLRCMRPTELAINYTKQTNRREYTPRQWRRIVKATRRAEKITKGKR